MKTNHRVQRALLLVVLLGATHAVLAQDTEDAKNLDDFRGSVSVTTKGISTIPNLTLGKPAAVFTMSAEKNGLSFEPEFRFSLEGQPWSFLFWWRYDLVRSEKFRLDVGAHPAISFRPFYLSENGMEREVNEARRFLAGELSSSYRLTRNVSVGTYYLYSHGFEASVPSNTNYLSLNTSFSDIGLAKGFYLNFRPQVYYLNIDARDGFYFTLTTILTNTNLPFALSSLVNTPLQTSIPGSPDLLWNVSLTYAFDLVD